MMVLVVYDIANNQRRAKVAAFLEGRGRRIQESVFECFVSLEQMQKLYQQIQKKVKLQEDNVRFYWIPADSLPRTLTIGSPPPEPPPTYYII